MYIRFVSVTVDSNTISGNNNTGVYVRTNFERPAADTLRYNTIINNGSNGIYVQEYASPFVQYNDLYGHSEYDYYNENTTGSELDARYNWWGEETTAEMHRGGNPKNIGKIYDNYDDSNRGFVNYGGYLSELVNPYVPVEIYVSTNGSDVNDGSEGQPFASIQQGINAANNGDTVHVAAGT
jgi:hypothetical protein